MVPYPAGGGTDLVARLVVPKLAERWKQMVVIDNKGGASGILGSDIVAKAAADGYTLLVMTSAHTINPFTTKPLPYDTEQDFTPITILIKGALALVGSPKAGFDSMEKFLTAARANPGKYQFGSTENTTRMVGELFGVKSGLKIENVAYKGAAPMMQELVGGHIPVGFTSPLTAMSSSQRHVKMLAVTSEKRLEVLPDVPTMAERVCRVSTGRPGSHCSAPATCRRSWRAACGTTWPPCWPSPRSRPRSATSPASRRRAADAFARRISEELVVWRDTAKAAGIEPE